MTVACIVQARLGSTRFPGKVLAPLCGKPVLQHVLERCKQVKGVDVVELVCPSGEANEALYPIAMAAGAGVCRGSEHDVLARYLHAAQIIKASVIMRITGDCPLIDPDVCESVLNVFRRGGVDYCSNVFPKRTMPKGWDCEVFSMALLERTAAEATDLYDREHVTSWMQRQPDVKRDTVALGNIDMSAIDLCVDYPEDIARLEQAMKEAA